HFERRQDFDLVGYWTIQVQEFVDLLTQYQFTLRIDSRRLSVAKWEVPGRHEVIEPPAEDGWLKVRFRVESVDVARMFVVGLGPQAIVIDPPELRDSIVEFARELIRLYQSSENHSVAFFKRSQ